jgi:hypothetical protein
VVTGSNPILGYDGIKINMKLVSQDSLTTMEENTVLTFDKIVSVSTGWVDFILDFPFIWDGTSDLLIEFCYSKQADNAKDIMVKCTDVGFGANAYADGTGSGNQTKGCEIAYAGNSHLRPNIRIELQPTFSIVGSLMNDGLKTAPALAYLDGDTLPEMITGNYSGGLRYYKGDVYSFPNISISEEELLSKFVMFPNPATDRVNIRIDALENEDFDVNVFDLNGRLLMSQRNLSEHVLNTSALQSGLYIVQVKYEGSVYASQKLIILND